MYFSGPLIQGIFLKRPNRFLAEVKLDLSNNIVQAHVPDPGRLKELLIKEAPVILREALNKSRKTQYSLIGVKKDKYWVNIDSHSSNKLFLEQFYKIENIKKFKVIKQEFSFGKSRFDFLMKTNTNNNNNSNQVLVEIKSVTLEKDGIAFFPDAPTVRGTKHVNELVDALKKGYQGYIIFLIKMENVNSFAPNYSMDPKFTSSLKRANRKGVNIIALKCSFDPIIKKELNIICEVPVIGLD